MTSPSARKGDTFERSTVDYLRTHLGAHLTRPRPGAIHDRCDIAGITDWTLEVKCYTDTLRAIRDGLADLAAGMANTHTRHGAVIVKRRGITDPARQLFVTELGLAVPLIHATSTTQR